MNILKYTGIFYNKLEYISAHTFLAEIDVTEMDFWTELVLGLKLTRLSIDIFSQFFKSVFLFPQKNEKFAPPLQIYPDCVESFFWYILPAGLKNFYQLIMREFDHVHSVIHSGLYNVQPYLMYSVQFVNLFIEEPMSLLL